VQQTPIAPLSTRKLALVSGAALAAAALLFAAFVLPAEFHRDPLGVGRLTGISKLAGPKTMESPAAALGQASATTFSSTAWRTDTVDIPLNTADAGVGGEELEYKVRMKKGDTIVYSWTADLANPEELYYDFHGETPPDPEISVIEYKQATGTSSGGSLTAPATGIHGWYLQNQSAKPTVVRLKLSGFYELVPPGGKGNEAGIKAASQSQ
jgi:hypothetical protein